MARIISNLKKKINKYRCIYGFFLLFESRDKFADPVNVEVTQHIVAEIRCAHPEYAVPDIQSTYLKHVEYVPTSASCI